MDQLADQLYNQSSYNLNMQKQGSMLGSKDKQFRLGELLGEGQFGKVYHACSNSYTEQLAIKIIRRSKFLRNQKLKHLLKRQMEVLSGFKHPSVIQFHQLVIDKQDIYLVYEYCEGGTLQDKITMTQQQILPLLYQIVDAMAHAQKLGIIHRDIKPANILFKDGRIKIADWGFSRLLGQGQTTCSFIGSPAYMAPQVLKGDQYTIKADVWSLGVVLYESLTGLCPWNSNSVSSLYDSISKKPLVFPKDTLISSNLQRIIKNMLNISPLQRPAFRQIQQRLTAKNTKLIREPSCSKLAKSQLILSKKKGKEVQEQQKIASCVYFLEMVQWCRKNVSNSQTLLRVVELVQKNLSKLRPLETQEPIFSVWEKERKVIREIKLKLMKKIGLTQPRKATGTADSESSFDCELNPEGQWQFLAKSTIKMVIQLLEKGYKQLQNQQKKKHSMLIEINLLLDLIIFQDIENDYLKSTFNNYQVELQSYTAKTLLKLINCKLVLINKKYYK